MGFFWRHGSESEDFLVQFTLAPQSSWIGVCIVQHFHKRSWIGATLVYLMRLRAWVIVKLAMDHYNLKELVTLQYGSFGTLSKQAKQLAWRTGWSHWMGDEVAAVPRWPSLKTLEMEFGMGAGVGALPHCLHHVKERAAMQHVKTPPPGPAAEDTTPMPPSVQSLLGSQVKTSLGWLKTSTRASTNWLLGSSPADARTSWWAGPMADEGWPSKCYMLRQVPIQGIELGHHHQRKAGMKALQSHSSLGTALCIPVEHSPQGLCRAGSTPMFPWERMSKPLPSCHEAMNAANHSNLWECPLGYSFLLLALKPPVSNSCERAHQWGVVTPCGSAHTVGADISSSFGVHHRGVKHWVRHIPGLPPGVLPGLHAPNVRDKWLHCSFSCPQSQSHQQESLGEGVNQTWPGIAPMHTVRCSHSHQESTALFSPKSPAQKLVWFNLMGQDDLEDSPQLSSDLTSFLEWPEGAADEGHDAWSLTTTMASCPLVRPGMTKQKRASYQQHSTTMRDLWTHCMMPDPIKQPREWVRACAEEMKTPPYWWPEFLALNSGCSREFV